MWNKFRNVEGTKNQRSFGSQRNNVQRKNGGRFKLVNTLDPTGGVEKREVKIKRRTRSRGEGGAWEEGKKTYKGR